MSIEEIRRRAKANAAAQDAAGVKNISVSNKTRTESASEVMDLDNRGLQPQTKQDKAVSAIIDAQTRGVKQTYQKKVIDPIVAAQERGAKRTAYTQLGVTSDEDYYRATGSGGKAYDAAQQRRAAIKNEMSELQAIINKKGGLRSPTARDAFSKLQALDKEDKELAKVKKAGFEDMTFGERASEWTKGLLAGAGLNYGAGLLDTNATLYEASQGSRSQMNSMMIEDAKRNYETALRDLQMMKEDGESEKAIAQQQSMVDQFKATYDAMAHGLNDETQSKAISAARDFDADVARKGAEYTQRAVDVGNTRLGQQFTQGMSSAIQSAVDGALAAAVAPGTMIPFAIRCFGNSTIEARNSGADINTQLVYGMASTAKEVLTEKMGNIGGIQKMAYGKGFSGYEDAITNGIKRAVDAFADRGASAMQQEIYSKSLTLLASMFEEGFEEFVGDIFDPAISYATGVGDLPKNFNDWLENAANDFVVGSLSALAGMPASGIRNSISDAQYAKVGKNIKAAGYDTLVEIEKASLINNESVKDVYEKAWRQYRSTNGVTDATLGQLYSANQQELARLTTQGRLLNRRSTLLADPTTGQVSSLSFAQEYSAQNAISSNKDVKDALDKAKDEMQKNGQVSFQTQLDLRNAMSNHEDMLKMLGLSSDLYATTAKTDVAVNALKTAPSTVNVDSAVTAYTNVKTRTGGSMSLDIAKDKADIATRLANGEAVTQIDLNKLQLDSKNFIDAFNQVAGTQLTPKKYTVKQVMDAVNKVRVQRQQELDNISLAISQMVQYNQYMGTDLAKAQGMQTDEMTLTPMLNTSDSVETPIVTEAEQGASASSNAERTIQYAGQTMSKQQFGEYLNTHNNGEVATPEEINDLFERAYTAQNGGSNGERENVSDGSSERDAGKSTGERSESVVGRAAEAEGGAAEDHQVKLDNGKTITAIGTNKYTPEMQKISSAFKGVGYRVEFTNDPIPVFIGKDVNGVDVWASAGGETDPKQKRVILQANASHSLDELYKHEYIHARLNGYSKFTRQTVVREFIEKAKSELSEGAYNELLKSYLLAYSGVASSIKNSAERELYVMEECLADSFGQLNRKGALDAFDRAKLNMIASDVLRSLDKQDDLAEAAEDTYREDLEAFNDKDEVIARATEDGTVRLSMSTYDSDGRAYLVNYLNKAVKKKDLTEEDATDMLRQLDAIYDICKTAKDARNEDGTPKYQSFANWSDAAVITDEKGNPVFSVVKKNGEYSLNLDFSLVCKKRRTLDMVFRELTKSGVINNMNLAETDISKINDLIRSHGFETACALCFVDAKRYRVGQVADAFTSLYNTEVKLIKRKDGEPIKYKHFNYGGTMSITNENADTLDTIPTKDLDFSALDEYLKTGNDGEAFGNGSVEAKTAKLLKQNAKQRQLLLRGDFISAESFESVKKNNPEVMKLYNSKKGTGGPKASEGDVQYLNDILKKYQTFTRNKAYSVGGVRIQSFSDYIPRMVFDYAQMVSELAAKKLPAHAYTKEELFALQFGLTGIKINMSLIPDVVEGGVAPGLDANGEYVWRDGQSFGGTVNEEGSAQRGFELALRIQNAEGYSKNCGTIAVGISDEHIRKMMSDPNIRMIIPYHKSSLNHEVAMMNNIGLFTDYTNSQNTRHKDGTNLSKDNAADKKLLAEMPDFNQMLFDGTAKTPQEAIEKYVRFCEENDLLPKFDQFVYKEIDGVIALDAEGKRVINENYYKLIEDFTVYDNGEYVQQGDVQMQFPDENSAFGSMDDLINRGLEEDALLAARQDKEVPVIVKEITESVRNSLTDDGTRYSIEEIDGRLMPVVDTRNDTRDYKAAEAYLMTLVSVEHPFATILADAQPVYVGRDLPGEYKSSEYTKAMDARLRTVKMQAATNLNEMLLLAENGEWRNNLEAKHNTDAQNGWYRYPTEFAVPVKKVGTEDIDHHTIYSGVILIRNDADGKSYLYDMVDVQKKKTAYASTPSQSGVLDARLSSTDTVAQPDTKSQEENTERHNERYSLSDAEYLELAKDPEKNRERLQRTVRATAEQAGYTTPDLYHGTPSFGFTTFRDGTRETPFIYTSTKREVAAHYAGDNNYAFARDIGKAYRNGDSIEDIIHNAKQVYGSDYRLMTRTEKQAVFDKHKAEAVAVADRIDELHRPEFDFPEDVANAISWVSDLFYNLRDSDVQNPFEAEDNARAEWVEWMDSDISHYEESSRIIHDYASDNWKTLSKEEKAFFSYLRGYELGDVAIEVAYRLRKVLNEGDLLINSADNISVPGELKDALDESHRIGAYHLYGNLGEKPFIFDANGGQFYALKVPEVSDSYTDTDAVCKWAVEHGYTSVVMKNIYDYGDKADNYVFFNSEQVKSADPVTYDDAGNVIPLSERFNDKNEDIRYSLGYHAGDLGKAEDYWAMMSGSRGTGHFGSGTYFVGNKEKITSDDYYGKRPQHAIDFSDYNLFTPKTNEQGYSLHDMLKGINDNILRLPTAMKDFDTWYSERKKVMDALDESSADEWNGLTLEEANENREIVRKYVEDNFTDYEKQKLERDVEDAYNRAQNRKFTEYDRERLYKDYAEYAALGLVGDETSDDYVARRAQEIVDRIEESKRVSKDDWYFGGILERALNDHFDRNESVRNWYRRLPLEAIRSRLNVSDEKLYSALSMVYEQVKDLGDGYMEHANDIWIDSPSTMFMKQLGYEGIDVRGLTGLDNTKYGSVIYDLKPETVRYSISAEAQAEFDAMLKQYGAQPQSPRDVRDEKFPSQTNEDTKVERSPRTVANAAVTPEARIDDIKDATLSGKFDYVPSVNKIEENKARAKIQRNGFQSAKESWLKDVEAGQTGANLVAMGATLINNAGNNQSCTAEEYIELVTVYSDLLTRSGQAVQAAQILQKMSPEGKLYSIQKTLDKMNEKQEKQARKKKGKDFDPESADFQGQKYKIPENLVEEYRKAKTDAERDEVVTKMVKAVAEQVQTSNMDRWTAWRYLNMLGNFRTQIRNVFGNAMFQPVRMTKDAVAGILETLLPVDERTASAKVDKATYKAALKVYDEYREAILAGGKYKDDAGLDFEGKVNDARQIFGKTKYKAWNKTAGALLEKYRTATNTAMDVGDSIFCSFTFADSVARFMAANNATWDTASEELRTRAVNKAVKDAAEATYRDNTKLARWVSSLGRSESTPTAVKGILEGVLPFRKTPANILMRAVEYGPVGLAQAAYDAVQKKTGKKDISANEIIDELAKGLTGSALIGLGFALAAVGGLIGRAPDDDDEKALFEQQGYQAYSLVLGGHTFTLDWLAPESIPLFLGANIHQAAIEGGLSMKDVMSAISLIGDPLMEMSMLQGVNDALENAATYGTEAALLTFIVNSMWGYASQGLTNTLVGQFERGTNNTRMTTYVDKNADLPQGLQRTIGKTSAKIPGWDYHQIPYIDAWGKPEKNADSATWNFITQLFSPAYVSTVQHNANLDEIERVYKATGDRSVIRTGVNKYINVKPKNSDVSEKRELTAEQYLTYAITSGETADAGIAALINTPQYQVLNDAEKAEAINRVYKYADEVGKAAVFDDYVQTKWVDSTSTHSIDLGVSMSTYSAMYAATKDIKGIYKDAEKKSTAENSTSLRKMQAIYSMAGDLTKEQIKAIAEDCGVGKTVLNYPPALVDAKLEAYERLYGQYN